MLQHILSPSEIVFRLLSHQLKKVLFTLNQQSLSFKTKSGFYSVPIFKYTHTQETSNMIYDIIWHGNIIVKWIIEKSSIKIFICIIMYMCKILSHTKQNRHMFMHPDGIDYFKLRSASNSVDYRKKQQNVNISTTKINNRWLCQMGDSQLGVCIPNSNNKNQHMTRASKPGSSLQV